MYQLTPISLKPEVRASRIQHGQFQNKIQNCVDKILCEVEVVDMTNRQGKTLFNLMDKFFSYGLYSGDQAYWRFVREFLPKTEQSILKAEWGDVNDRRLSIAWLKDAFNKGTLSFQMMAFKGSKKVIARFYHPNACMMNGGMLEAICNLMEKLITVQFAFYSRVNLRQEPAQAVVVQASTIPAAKILKAKRRENWVADSVPVRPNLPNPDPNEFIIGTPADQELVLDGLVRQRRNRQRMNSECFSFDKEETPISGPTPQQHLPEPPKVTESFDEVLIKVSSRIKMEHLLDESKSFDNMLHIDNLKIDRKEEEPVLEGEEFVDSGDAMQLATNVFIEQTEKLVKMYHVFEKFAVGDPKKRLLAITNRNIYTISKTIAPGLTTPLEGSSNTIYITHCVMDLENIDSIDVGTDYQQLIFYPKTGKEFTFTEGNVKEEFIIIGTGDRNLGRSILSNIQVAYANNKPSSILSQNSPQDMIVRRYVNKELPKTVPNEVKNISLIYWKETATGVQTQGVEHAGFLYWKFNQTNWWRRPQGDYDQAYFLLRQDRKLYMFTDSSMKEGIQIHDLRNCIETIEIDQKKDFQWSIELVFPDGNLQLFSQSKDELIKWLQLISTARTMPDEEEVSAAMCIMTESHIAIVQEGARCIHDGFMRTLTTFELTGIQAAWILKGGESKLFLTPHTILVLQMDSYFEWLFFRSESELERMREVMSAYPVDLKEIRTTDEPTRDTAALITLAQRCPDLWGKHVDDSDVAEVHED